MWRCIALIGLATTAPVMGQNTVAQVSYFPAVLGATWTYQLADRTVTVRVAAHEKQDSVMTARLETTSKNEVVGIEHLVITDKVVARRGLNGDRVNPPLTLLQLPLTKGLSWEIDTKLAAPGGSDEIKGKCSTDEEDVKVPAGNYVKAMRVTADLTINGRKVRITNWYAENVGLVKQRMRLGGNDLEMVLEKVEIPK